MSGVNLPGSTERLFLPYAELALIREILAEHLPGQTVWAFGSRATGKHLKPFSDLDLAVEGQLTWAKRAALSDAFDEALINFKVDVVELGMVDAEFRRRIEQDFMIVQSAGWAEAAKDSKAAAVEGKATLFDSSNV